MESSVCIFLQVDFAGAMAKIFVNENDCRSLIFERARVDTEIA